MENHIRRCKNCNKPIAPEKKAIAEFCNPSCKARYHEKKKSGAKIKITETENLEPVSNTINGLNFENTITNNQNTEHSPKSEISDTTPEVILPEQFIIKVTKEETPNYKFNNGQLSLCRKYIATCENEIKRLTNAIETEKNRNGAGFCLAGAASGAMIGNKIATPKQQPPKDGEITLWSKSGTKIPLSENRQHLKKEIEQNNAGKKLLYSALGGLLGFGFGKVLSDATQDSREQSKIENIKKYQQQIIVYENNLQSFKQMEPQLLSELSKFSQYIDKEEKVLNPAYTEALNQQKKRESTIEGLSGSSGVTQQNNNVIKQQSTEFENDKITSMQNIVDMKFILLNFKGKWREFFGLPQTNFFCVIHGAAGEGKSTFAIQLAKYCAGDFGNVLIVSGEEGFAPTFQQKIKLLGANVANLYAGDIRTGIELLNEVPTNKFHFIVIDSLNNMGIDHEIMKQIRNKFKHSAIIAICQNTKDGKMRGSYEIIHDSDITVKVTNGIAVTTKNRFKQKDQKFDVFEGMSKKETQNILPEVKKQQNENKGMDSDLRNTI